MARPFLDFISAVNSIIVLFVLLVIVDTQGPTVPCVPEIKVRKNTVYTASRESMLNISCPVTYCEKIPTVRWIKFDDTNKQIPISETSQITITQAQSGLKDVVSNLSFKSISTHDNGIYRCLLSVSNFSLESHNININVSDSVLKTVDGTSHPITANNPTEPTATLLSWLPYVFICLGIICLVVIVMLISFLSINRCSRKTINSRKKNATSCQMPLSPSISKSDGNLCTQEMPEGQNNVYDASTDTLQPELDSLYPGIDQEDTPNMRNGKRRGSTSQQIVYATLEHLTPRELSAVRHQSREQLSEYASIRLG